MDSDLDLDLRHPKKGGFDLDLDLKFTGFDLKKFKSILSKSEFGHPAAISKMSMHWHFVGNSSVAPLPNHKRVTIRNLQTKEIVKSVKLLKT